MSAVDVYTAIADPTRRGLLDLLAEGARPVKRLAEPFAMTRPAGSQHLRVLREPGLVTEPRARRERGYQLPAAPLPEVGEWVGHFGRFCRGRLEARGAHPGRA